MPRDYTLEQKWKLFEKLSPDLQETIFSMETANSVYDICEKNEINEIQKVAKIVGDILLGLLSPDGLQETLGRELKLRPEIAKKVTQEINRFVLYSIRKSLATLYKTEVGVPPTKTGEVLPKKKREVPKKPKEADVYRESIEKK